MPRRPAISGHSGEHTPSAPLGMTSEGAIARRSPLCLATAGQDGSSPGFSTDTSRMNGSGDRRQASASTRLDLLDHALLIPCICIAGSLGFSSERRWACQAVLRGGYHLRRPRWLFPYLRALIGPGSARAMARVSFRAAARTRRCFSHERRLACEPHQAHALSNIAVTDHRR
jgi:hypothetical protein